MRKAKAYLIRRAAISIVPVLFAIPSLQAAGNFNITDFDPSCGKALYNCRTAFHEAFESAAKAGGGTLHLPAGTFFVDFPELASNVHAGPPILPSSLLAVPAGLLIQGHVAPNGVPDSVIEWKITSIPVFVFANIVNSGMKDLHLRFKGNTPSLYPYGDIDLLRALGFQPKFPHTNQMGGENSEMSSFAMLFGSEHCTFDNLLFDSATADNQHVLGYAIDVKGAGIATGEITAGLSRAADGNRFTNIKVRDFIMGFMVYSQSNLLMENIDGNWRGSSKAVAPGHLIYFNGGSLFGPGGKHTTTPNHNVTVKNITEGSDTLSNLTSLGTFAIKILEDSTFQHIISSHPAGLIQSLFSVQNTSFEDVHWSSNRRLCDEEAYGCGLSVVNSVEVAGELPNRNLTFKDVTFRSTVEPITVTLIGQKLDLDGITIETPPGMSKKQTSSYSALAIKNSADVTIRNYDYIPLLRSFDPGATYNAPMGCWGSCSNIKGDARINWPGGVPLPDAKHRILNAIVQDQRPEAQNSINAHLRTK